MAHSHYSPPLRALWCSVLFLLLLLLPQRAAADRQYSIWLVSDANLGFSCGKIVTPFYSSDFILESTGNGKFNYHLEHVNLDIDTPVIMDFQGNEYDITNWEWQGKDGLERVISFDNSSPTYVDYPREDRSFLGEYIELLSTNNGLPDNNNEDFNDYELVFIKPQTDFITYEEDLRFYLYDNNDINNNNNSFPGASFDPNGFESDNLGFFQCAINPPGNHEIHFKPTHMVISTPSGKEWPAVEYVPGGAYVIQDDEVVYIGQELWRVDGSYYLEDDLYTNYYNNSYLTLENIKSITKASVPNTDIFSTDIFKNITSITIDGELYDIFDPLELQPGDLINNQLGNFPKLNTLKISRLNLIFDDNSFSVPSSVERIDFESCDVKKEENLFLWLEAPGLKHLKVSSLELSGLQLNCPQLEYLDISNNHIVMIDLSSCETSLQEFKYEGNVSTLRYPVSMPVDDFYDMLQNGELLSNDFNPERIIDFDGAVIDGDMISFIKPMVSYTYNTLGGATTSQATFYLRTSVEQNPEDGVPLTEDYFPDKNFREWAAGFDTNKDFLLSVEERGAAKMYWETSFNGAQGWVTMYEAVYDFTGIEYFHNLETFYYNHLAGPRKLDLTHNSKLKTLYITYPHGLEELDCHGLQIQSIVVCCPDLKYLDISHNRISYFNARDRREGDWQGFEYDGAIFWIPNIEYLDISNNVITNTNQVEALNFNLGTKPNLKYFDCSNNLLTDVDVSRANQSLEYFNCEYNELTGTIDVSGFTNLKKLLAGGEWHGGDYHYNSFSRLEAGGCTKLDSISIRWDSNSTAYCDVNGTLISKADFILYADFDTVNISNCRNLQYFTHEGSTIGLLDARGCTNLQEVVDLPERLVYSYGNDEETDELPGVGDDIRLKGGDDGGNRLISNFLANGCSALKVINSNILSFDLEGCNAIEEFEANGGEMERIDFSGMETLRKFYLGSNGRRSFYPSDAGDYYYCDGKLKYLNLGGCTNLDRVYWGGLPLDTVIISGTAIGRIDYSDYGDYYAMNSILDCYDFAAYSDGQHDYSNVIKYIDISNCKYIEAFYGGYQWDGEFYYYQDHYLKSLEYFNASGCTSLTNITIPSAKLSGSGLCISGCTALEKLYISGNKLDSLDVSCCTYLNSLNCNNNNISYLNISNTAIDRQPSSIFMEFEPGMMTCFNNPLKTLVARNCAISNLRIPSDPETGPGGDEQAEYVRQWREKYCVIETIDVTDSKNLLSLQADFQPKLRQLVLEGCDVLSGLFLTGCRIDSLDISSCHSIVDLAIDGNGMSYLDASNTKLGFAGGMIFDGNELKTLKLANTPILMVSATSEPYETYGMTDEDITQWREKHCVLEHLDVTGCDQLTMLSVPYQHLSELHVDGCTSLAELYVNHNRFDSLDVSGCRSLSVLECMGNGMEYLNISNTAVGNEGYPGYLSCSNNPLKTLIAQNCQMSEFSLPCEPEAGPAEGWDEYVAQWREQNCLLEHLDVTGCSRMTRLSVPHQRLSELLLDGCASLQTLDVSYNLLEGINGLDSYYSPYELVADYFDSHGHDYNGELDIAGAPRVNPKGKSVTPKDVTENPDWTRNLKKLYLNNNQLWSLSLINMPQLKLVRCENNPLSSLYIDNCPEFTGRIEGTEENNWNWEWSSFLGQDIHLETFVIKNCPFNDGFRYENGEGQYIHYIDLSNTNAGEVVFNNFDVFAINVDGCDNLYTLSCNNNRLQYLSVPNNSNSMQIDCSHNRIEELDLNDSFVYLLDCSNNNLKQLRDFRYVVWSAAIDCSHNDISDLNYTCLSGWPDHIRPNLDLDKSRLKDYFIDLESHLGEFNCSYNNLSVIDAPPIRSFDMPGKFNCSNNYIVEIYGLDEVALDELDCSNNEIMSLDLSGQTELHGLNCAYNHLTSLDLRHNGGLRSLNCDDNQLTSLDLSLNTNLEEWSCERNFNTIIPSRFVKTLENGTTKTYYFCWLQDEYKGDDLSFVELVHKLEGDQDVADEVRFDLDRVTAWTSGCEIFHGTRQNGLSGSPIRPMAYSDGLDAYDIAGDILLLSGRSGSVTYNYDTNNSDVGDVGFRLNWRSSTITTDVDELTPGAPEVKEVRYINTAGVSSSEPWPGVNIVVKTLTDGSRVVTKELK